MIIHYSRDGYNGDYTYDSVCGKKVRTHQNEENSSVSLIETTCELCKKTPEFITDYSAWKGKRNVKRRIYIESDILQADEFKTAKRSVKSYLKKNNETFVDRVFSDVLDFAWHDLERTWKAIKKADEIYATTSLIPIAGGYTGAPLIFDKMCEKAIKSGIKGKKIVILNTSEYISWNHIDLDLMKKAFKENTLILFNDDWELEEFDISKIKE